MGKKILVTGATGFVGSAVVRELLGQGKEVRALVRKSSSLDLLDDLDVEKVFGDLTDVDSLENALKGCDLLYHVAAKYSLWNTDPKEIYEVNVEGTRRLLGAALKNGVSKVVYTSTVGTLAFARDKVTTEDSLTTLEECYGHYKRSKLLAEQVALDFVQKGLPLVIVSPTAPVGEGDFKPTPTGRIIVDFCKGRMWGYTATGLNLVYVGDVAKGHVLAAEKGRVGERYILGNHNLSLKEILELLSELTGTGRFRFPVPHSLVYAMALGGELLSRLTKARPLVSLEEAYLAKNYMYFDSSKAIRELGFEQTDIRIALGRAVEWFQQKRYV